MTVTATVYLEVNGVPLATYAWHTFGSGYDELLNSPAVYGGDIRIPGAKGVYPLDRIIDATPVSVPLLIDGRVDEDGAPMPTPELGIFEHRDYLNGALAIGKVVPAVFYRGTLPALSGDVTVLGLRGWTTLGRFEAMARLDLLVPAGELTAEGGSS